MLIVKYLSYSVFIANVIKPCVMNSTRNIKYIQVPTVFLHLILNYQKQIFIFIYSTKNSRLKQ